MKIRWNKVLGMSLAFAGISIFYLGGYTSITGMAISESLQGIASLWYYVLGTVMILAGIIMNVSIGREFFAKRELEGMIIAPNILAERISGIEREPEKIDIMLDTSAILDYTPEGLQNFLAPYNKVFVPNSVLAEIKNARVKEIIEKNSMQVEGFEQYRAMAKDYLERTEKPQLRKFLLPYLEDPSLIEKAPKRNSLLIEIGRKTERLKKLMAKEGEITDYKVARMAPQYAERKIMDYLKHCEVSEADIDVLAYALKTAEKGKKAVITERDIDFEQAVDIVRAERPNIGRYIYCINNYRKAA